MGFASKLVVKPDAAPTIYPDDNASTSRQVGQTVSLFFFSVSNKSMCVVCSVKHEPVTFKRTLSPQLSEFTLKYRQSQGFVTVFYKDWIWSLLVKPPTKVFRINTDRPAEFRGLISTSIKDMPTPFKKETSRLGHYKKILKNLMHSAETNWFMDIIEFHIISPCNAFQWKCNKRSADKME